MYFKIYVNPQSQADFLLQHIFWLVILPTADNYSKYFKNVDYNCSEQVKFNQVTHAYICVYTLKYQHLIEDLKVNLLNIL